MALLSTMGRFVRKKERKKELQEKKEQERQMKVKRKKKVTNLNFEIYKINEKSCLMCVFILDFLSHFYPVSETFDSQRRDRRL